MKIAVIATGKIGLPLAVQFASMGHQVVGVDINAELVQKVNRGEEPFPGEEGLREKLAEVVAQSRLTATTDYRDAVPQADAVVVVVPLLVDESGTPDFTWMDAAVRSVASHLTPGTLVSFETTLPVGTTRTRWRPLIESVSGLVEGKDFHLAFSPERVLTGRVFSDLRKYPKLVGGLSTVGGAKAVDFYEGVLQFDERDDLSRPNGVWDMGTAEAAEMAKLAETTYRDVNIALANQFARYADREGLDFYKVIEACNSQPYSRLHYPGIAVGGHCIPVYPLLYLSTDPHADIVRVAREYNWSMPAYAVRRVEEEVGDLNGVRVAILGVAYRGGVKESAVSGVFPIYRQLRQAGADVYVHDPLFSTSEIEALDLREYVMGSDVDVVILQAEHSEYHDVRASDFPGVRLLFDGRNFMKPDNWTGVRKIVIGKGD